MRTDKYKLKRKRIKKLHYFNSDQAIFYTFKYNKKKTLDQ